MESRPSHYNSRYKHDLSPQQQRVLELIEKGHTNLEIADALDLSLDGVKWHVREVLAKLEVESREEAAEWWRAYQRPAVRASRALSVLMGIGLWKASAAVGGFALVSAVAVGAALTFRGGLGSASDDTPPACTAENMRWETVTERVGDSTRLTLSIALRNPDWYEGLFHALGISDRNVDSPCQLATDVSVEMYEMIPLPDWPSDRGPAPIVPQKRLDGVTGDPAFVTLDTTLKTGSARPVLVVEFSNWCVEQPKVGAQIMIPAYRPGGPPLTHQGLSAELPSLPLCSDLGDPAQLRVTAVP